MELRRRTRCGALLMFVKSHRGGRVLPSTVPCLRYYHYYYYYHRLLLLFLFLLFLLTGTAEADIHLRVVKDTRRVILLGTFAFGSKGAARLRLSEFSVPIEMVEKHVNHTALYLRADPIGFVVEPTESVALARVHARYARGEIGTPALSGHIGGSAERPCFIKDPLVRSKQPGAVIFELQHQSLSSIITQSPSFPIERSGLYAIYFYNCADIPSNGQPALLKTLPKRPVTFTVDVELSWWSAKGTIVHLSYGDADLPFLYNCFACIFLLMTVLWAWQLLMWRRHVKKIHFLMCVLVFVKTVTLALESVKLRHYSETGQASLWDYLFYATLTLKGVMLFGVVLLLGSGWSLMRAYISTTDKRILFAVVPCQVMLNVCLAIIEETSEGNRGWGTWFDILQVLDVVCCCCVLFPIVWSIKRLRETSRVDESTARTITRMREFRTFYVVVVAYIYFTRIVLIMVDNAVPFDKTWIANAGAEVIAVVFYTFCGHRFRPQPPGSYESLQCTVAVHDVELAEVND